MTQQRRVIAYDPITLAPLDELPSHVLLETVRNLQYFPNLPTIKIVYPSKGVNRTLLNNYVMLGVERLQGDGSYEEFWNSRYLLSGTPNNDDYTEGTVNTYEGVGVGVRCKRSAVYTASPSDQPDGTPVEPMRHWVNKTVGAIAGDIFTEQQALGFLPGLTKDWGFSADSTGAPWTGAETLPYYEASILMPFDKLIEDLSVRLGLIDVVFNGTEMRMFIARTQAYRDLTVGPDPVGFYWGPQNGITSVTEKIDYQSTITDALVVGADGQTFTPHNFGSDGNAYDGPSLVTLNVPWAHNADMAHAACESLFRAGAAPRRELRAMVNLDSSRIEPDKDFRVGDRMILQKGDNPDTPAGTKNFGEQRVLTITETDDKFRKASITFADRLHRLELLAAWRAENLAAGAQVGMGGRSRPPQPSDRREPTAPTSFVVTPGNYTEAAGIQLASFSATWAHDGNAVPDPVTGQVKPLLIKGFELEYQSTDTGSDWQLYRRFKSTATSGTIKGLSATATGYMFRIRAVPFTGITPSAYATTGTIAVPTDQDVRRMSAGKAYDAAFLNADIQAKRTADSGSSGLTWPTVSGRVVAQISDTTAVLKSGTAGTLTSGRVAAQGLEKWIVGGTGKRSAGSGATIQFGVRSWTRDGTATLVANVATITTTTSDQTTSAVYTMPANTVEAEWRVRMTSPSGSPSIQVHTPIFDRQASTARVEDTAITEVKHADNSVSTRTVVNDAITEPKHGPLSASTRVINNLAVTNGKTADDAQDPRTIAADAIETVHLSTGLAVDGVITTGDGMTFGGLDASNIDFPGTAAIADTGTGLAFLGVSNAAFSDSGSFTGTWDDVSTLSSKVEIKPVTREQCLALLGLAPVHFKRRQAWSREYGKRVIPDKHLPERWERDPKTGKKRRAPAKVIKGKVIPGKVDTRPHVGLIAEEAKAAGLDVLVVDHNDEMGTIGIDYMKVPMFMLPILRELVEGREEDRARIAALEAQLKDQIKGSSPPLGE